MISSRGGRSRAVRRGLPWVLWALAAAAAVPLARSATALGAVPAVAEARRATLGSPRTSRALVVRDVLAAPGQRVAAGQVLARMDPAELDLELAVARRNLEELELAALRTSVELRRLAAQERQERSELAQLDAAIAQESALASDRLGDLKHLNELKLRRAGLTARASGPDAAVPGARRAAAGASAGPAIPARTAGAGAFSPVADARREEVVRLEALRDRLELRAPFAGRVEAVLARAGEVAVGEQVITVVEERPAAAVAWVDERRATRVAVGDRVRLAARDGSGARAGGRVAALGPSVSELPARFWLLPSLPRWGRAVYVALDEPAFLPGQALEAAFLGPGQAGP